jgi:hypothetical protein
MPRFIFPASAPLFRQAQTAVDESFFQIESASATQIVGQRLQHAAHDTRANALLEMPMAGLVRRIPLGQVGPRCASA